MKQRQKEMEKKGKKNQKEKERRRRRRKEEKKETMTTKQKILDQTKTPTVGFKQETGERLCEHIGQHVGCGEVKDLLE
jgi:hypothetical protein